MHTGVQEASRPVCTHALFWVWYVFEQGRLYAFKHAAMATCCSPPNLYSPSTSRYKSLSVSNQVPAPSTGPAFCTGMCCH